MPHKLLLADDSVTIQRVVELTFAGEDVQVVAVSDGELAISRIPSERPDIILADIGMPKRTGYDVAAFVKGNSELRHIPVLLLAGAFEPVDEGKAQQAGSDGVLVKPFEPQHVISRVREFLNGKGSAAETRPRTTVTVDSPKARAALGAPVSPTAPAKFAPAPDSLDHYFEQLDAAFANIGGTAASLSLDTGDTGDADFTLPTLTKVLARSEPASPAPRASFAAPPAPALMPAPSATIPAPIPAPIPASTPAPLPAARPSTSSASTSSASAPLTLGAPDHGRTMIADAFSALLAVEAGEPGAQKLRLSTASNELHLTDSLVDEVTRRVLMRLAPASAREVVVQVVSELAERLIREEIARIRSK